MAVVWIKNPVTGEVKPVKDATLRVGMGWIVVDDPSKDKPTQTGKPSHK